MFCRVWLALALVLLLPVNGKTNTCKSCHPREVEEFSRFSMAHSLRTAGREPAGTFLAPDGTRFTISSDSSGAWQRMERAGESSEFRVEYVIGSGKHAAGYLIRMGDHLFQSPVGYYTARHAYDLAPGYENLPGADFTRPVAKECLLCHSGSPMPIAGTVNRYQTPAFEEETISCKRCHGPVERHLQSPVPGSIINPARLTGSARDSICEQCHLSGVIRILNPGKQMEDFQPGQALEQTFTVFTDALPAGKLKVISQSEQLAASACLRNSNGKLWCGTCHDPHQKPVNSVSYYRDRCLACHANKLPQSHLGASNGDCVGCHMPRRTTFDGGHTAFTDHRIARRPAIEDREAPHTSLIAWREPAAEFTQRNLGLAYIGAGLQQNTPAWILRGYRMLTEVQAAYANDPMVLNGFGAALLAGKQPHEAKFAFERLIQLEPQNPIHEENAGRADLASGNIDGALEHLERAVQLDPLLLSADGLLKNLYDKQGKSTEAAALAQRVRRAMNSQGTLGK